MAGLGVPRHNNHNNHKGVGGEEEGGASIGNICRRRCRRSMRSRALGMLDLAFAMEETIIERGRMDSHDMGMGACALDGVDLLGIFKEEVKGLF